MLRRAALWAWAVTCFGVPGARAQALGAFDAKLLTPDGPPTMLLRYQGAGGTLERFTSRPGAWYALLYVPLWPRWPVELALRAQRRGHALRLHALDAAPDGTPGVAVELPLRLEREQPGASWSSRIVLPERSVAEGVYVLIELWRSDFAPPPPLVARVRTVGAMPAGRTPWWSNPAAVTRVDAPPSPLTQAQRERGAFELPIWGPRAPADLPLPLARELLR